MTPIPIRIEVTQADIDRGTRSDCAACPIALAAARAVGFPCEADLTGLWFPLGMGHYVLPAAASDFVLAFDAGETVQPFAFEVGA